MLANHPVASYTSTLLLCRERLQNLLLATMSRLAGDINPPALPSGEYYGSTSYRLAYQCVGCHTRGAQSQAVPQ